MRTSKRLFTVTILGTLAMALTAPAFAQGRQQTRQQGPAPVVGAPPPVNHAYELCQISRVQVPTSSGLTWQTVVDCEDSE